MAELRIIDGDTMVTPCETYGLAERGWRSLVPEDKQSLLALRDSLAIMVARLAESKIQCKARARIRRNFIQEAERIHRAEGGTRLCVVGQRRVKALALEATKRRSAEGDDVSHAASDTYSMSGDFDDMDMLSLQCNFGKSNEEMRKTHTWCRDVYWIEHHKVRLCWNCKKKNSWKVIENSGSDTKSLKWQ